jgi:hypothetical protein
MHGVPSCCCYQYGDASSKLFLWVLAQLASDMSSNNLHHLQVGIGLFHTSFQDCKLGGIDVIGSIYSCLNSTSSNVLLIISLS